MKKNILCRYTLLPGPAETSPPFRQNNSAIWRKNSATDFLFKIRVKNAFFGQIFHPKLCTVKKNSEPNS